MTTTDLIMKSIENLILYGIEINISEEDSDEYLFQMEKYYNDTAEDMIATLDIDALLIDTIDGDNICNLFIKEGILRIVPTSNENTLNAIIVMLEFIAENNDMFEKKIIEEEPDEESDDDFEWI
jgi:hypothetical protein|tara:strand:+ start:130 stop:501 length:372 start_codon:yes stop_codon:yes gene_type:complete